MYTDVSAWDDSGFWYEDMLPASVQYTPRIFILKKSHLLNSELGIDLFNRLEMLGVPQPWSIWNCHQRSSECLPGQLKVPFTCFRVYM